MDSGFWIFMSVRRNGSVQKTKSSVLPARCVGSVMYWWSPRSCVRSRKSFEKLVEGDVRSSHLIWGKLKSPVRMHGVLSRRVVAKRLES